MAMTATPPRRWETWTEGERDPLSLSCRVTGGIRLTSKKKNSRSSISVSSSVYHFVEEFGRTYHRYKEGSKLHKPQAYSNDAMRCHMLSFTRKNIICRMTRYLAICPLSHSASPSQTRPDGDTRPDC